MISDYLTDDVIQTRDYVENWERAIEIASQPLLYKNIIEQKYIGNMIQSVYDNGPYIVLNDYFALPHAKAGVGVNEVGLSLLVVDEPVDLEGNPVKIFLVLAAKDSDSHLEVLSEILMDEDHFNTFLSGDKSEIKDVLSN